MLQTLTTRLSIAISVLVLAAAPASAAVVTRSYTFDSAALADIYSATFDGGLDLCSTPTPPDAQECAFFSGYPPAGRNITFSSTGTGSGTLNVNWETTTGEIVQVNEMLINMPDMTLDITHFNPQPATTETAHIVVIQGNGLPVVVGATASDNVFIEAGTGTLNRDLDDAGFFTTLGQGTADPDEAPAVGQAAIFQYSEPGLSPDFIPFPDAPDFSVFNDIVDSCTPGGTAPFTICGTIFGYLITLDAVKYRLEGTVKTTGNTSLILKAQTGNKSIYRVTLHIALDSDADGIPDATDTDDDNDGVLDVTDNCTREANNSGLNVQVDSNGDGYGNLCDADINNTNLTTATDFNLLRACINLAGYPSGTPQCRDSDMNASGTVTATDFNFLRARINTAPGPSGLHP